MYMYGNLSKHKILMLPTEGQTYMLFHPPFLAVLTKALPTDGRADGRRHPLEDVKPGEALEFRSPFKLARYLPWIWTNGARVKNGG